MSYLTAFWMFIPGLYLFYILFKYMLKQSDAILVLPVLLLFVLGCMKIQDFMDERSAGQLVQGHPRPIIGLLMILAIVFSSIAFYFTEKYFLYKAEPNR